GLVVVQRLHRRPHGAGAVQPPAVRRPHHAAGATARRGRPAQRLASRGPGAGGGSGRGVAGTHPASPAARYGLTDFSGGARRVGGQPMKTNHGTRTGHGCVVTVRSDGGPDRPLAPRWDLRNHSPAGYEWSYGGSGPAQLALALAADLLGDDGAALDIYQALKF